MNERSVQSGLCRMVVCGSRRLGVVALIAITGVGCSVEGTREQETFLADDGDQPYTHVEFANGPGDFRFAVIGDHTGGHRTGVFSAAVDALNLLRPDFVIGVGDLIEGYVEDEAVLRSQWEEVDGLLDRLDAPFFFVPGNHDINFDPSESLWFERSGATRSYSHFVYEDVLFLMMSTEDPPKKDVPGDLADKYYAIKAGELRDPAEVRRVITELEDWAGEVNISDAQVAYFDQVLADNPDVRWTFGFMHSPAWEFEDSWATEDPGNFARIEALLAERPYTMFGGHTHTYDHMRRNGRDYITLAMTGAGVPGKGSGDMDHVAWVTLTEEGPIISNVLLNGVFDKRGADPVMQDALLYRPRSER